MPDLAEIRARARQHEHDIDRELRYFTPKDLAARWQCSRSTVYHIPETRLAFMAIAGAKNITRRYHPDDVAAYEAAYRQASAA